MKKIIAASILAAGLVFGLSSTASAGHGHGTLSIGIGIGHGFHGGNGFLLLGNHAGHHCHIVKVKVGKKKWKKRRVCHTSHGHGHHGHHNHHGHMHW